MKLTPQEVKASYDRLKKGKKGYLLKLLKEVTLTLYQAGQDAKSN